MEERQDVTVPMPKKLEEAINGQLSYGDSRAEWIREAIAGRLRAEGVDIDNLDIDDINIEWIEGGGETDVMTDGGEVAAIAD